MAGEPTAQDLTIAPQQQTALIGHDQAERALRDAYLGGRLPHGWILAGPTGIGKATLAYRFARFVLTYPTPEAARAAGAGDLAVPAEHPVHAQIANAAHPDLFTVARTTDPKSGTLRAEIRAEEVRAATAFFSHTSGAGGYRVCILDRADEMNLTAANALLKVLEEPPERSLFLLVCDKPGALLSTIRSRCRIARLTPLNVEDLAAAIEAGVADPQTFAADVRARAAEVAGGSPGLAVRLLAGDGLALHARIEARINRLPQIDDDALIKLAEEVSARGADDHFALFARLLTGNIAGHARQAAAGGAANPAQATAWADAWAEISRSIHRANALNLDRKQVVLNAFVDLGKAVHQGTH